MKLYKFLNISEIRIHKFSLFIILILGLVSFTHGQTTKLDSIHLQKAFFYANTNPDSLLYYAKKMQESKEKCVVYYGIGREANAYYRKGDFNKSKELALYLIENINGNEDFCLKKAKIEAINRLFWIYKNSYELSKALETTIMFDQMLESLEPNSIYHKRQQIVNKSNKANIKTNLGLFDDARKIYKEIDTELTAILPLLENPVLYPSLLTKASILNLTGDIFLETATNKLDPKLDSALVYYNKAYQVTKSLNPQHKNSTTLFELRKSKVFIKKEVYTKAMHIVNSDMLYLKDFRIQQDVRFLKSVIFYNQKKVDSSFHYAYEFLNLKKTSPNTEKNRIVIQNILADQYKELHKIDSALKYSNLALINLDKLSKKRSEANNSHYLYDFEKVQNLNDSILKKQQDTFIKSYLILILLVIAIGLTGLNYYRKNKKLRSKVANAAHSGKTKDNTKKEYNINAEIESKILEGLVQIEASKEYLHSDFNINSLANELCTNTSYLSAVINEKKGKSFKSYYTELRINYLIEQLKKDSNYKKYTIKALGEEIGYTNASAFTRAFKNHTGKTPSEFIKNLES